MFFNKLFKFVILIILLTSFAIFLGCGGGNPVTPPIPELEPDDLEIPEPTEAMSQKVDLSVGETIEVTDPESPIVGVKLIVPPVPSNKDEKDSTATIAISYLDNPYLLNIQTS